MSIIDIFICIACRDSAHERGFDFDLDQLQEQYHQENPPIRFSDYVINHLNMLCEVQDHENNVH